MSHRIGMVGLGTIGQRMLQNAARHDGFTVSAGWDPDDAACRETAAAWPAVRLAGDAGGVIRADDVDVVYIGCPPEHHRGYVEQAIDAGKAILCEKPLAIDLDDAEAMVAAVEESRARAAINFVHASSAAVDLMAKALHDGALGVPVRADLRVQFSRWPRDWQARAQWLAYRAQGGFVREVVSHFVYLSLRLLGGAEVIDSIVTYPEDGRLCETAALAQFDCNGVPLTVAATAGGAGPDQVDYMLWGEHASLRLYDWFNLQDSDGGPWRERTGHIADTRTAAFDHQLDNLAALIEGRPHTMASFADALTVQRAVETLLAGG